MPAAKLTALRKEAAAGVGVGFAFMSYVQDVCYGGRQKEIVEYQRMKMIMGSFLQQLNSMDQILHKG